MKVVIVFIEAVIEFRYGTGKMKMRQKIPILHQGEFIRRVMKVQVLKPNSNLVKVKAM